jgi:hypothetical protein
MAVEKRAKE